MFPRAFILPSTYKSELNSFIECPDKFPIATPFVKKEVPSFNKLRPSVC